MNAKSLAPCIRLPMIRRAVPLAFVLACLFPPIAAQAQSREDYSFKMPIEYPSLGVGPQLTLGYVRLTPGMETAQVTRAIIDALQKMQMSIDKPAIALDDPLPLPQKKEWETDLVKIEPEKIKRHNDLHPTMKLDTRHTFWLRYKGSYQIVDRELIFKLFPVLEHSAQLGRPRPYKKPYSGIYFRDLLQDSVKIELAKTAEAVTE
jgi:hypothetical protein